MTPEELKKEINKKRAAILLLAKDRAKTEQDIRLAEHDLDSLYREQCKVRSALTDSEERELNRLLLKQLTAYLGWKPKGLRGNHKWKPGFIATTGDRTTHPITILVLIRGTWRSINLTRRGNLYLDGEENGFDLIKEQLQ